MHIYSIIKNKFNSKTPIMNLAVIEVCWEFIQTSLNIEKMYDLKDVAYDYGSLDASIAPTVQIRMMLRDIKTDHHPFTYVVFRLPSCHYTNDARLVAHHVKSKLCVIKGKIFKFNSNRNIEEV